ncbi:MAG: hypothetical protein HPY53_08480 [Brevinematales bacterium]|nr:hypothetical protein [Brevinematales bacterium]
MKHCPLIQRDCLGKRCVFQRVSETDTPAPSADTCAFLHEWVMGRFTRQVKNIKSPDFAIGA